MKKTLRQLMNSVDENSKYFANEIAKDSKKTAKLKAWLKQLRIK